MNALRMLRWVALVEGVSYVVLLFVAMPMKYLAGMPLAVRLVGAVHGALFVLFVVALVHAASANGWTLRRAAVAFASSIVPFGTFAFDRSLRDEIATAAAATSTPPG